MLIIGHRGTAGTAPENTLASFVAAVRAGVEMIELDVHRCAGGELVVIHDKKVNRTTNGTGQVNKKSLSELQQLNAGYGEKIPTLREVLDMLDKQVKINIELKGPDVAEPVFNLLEEYKSLHGWQCEDFYISSFDHSQLLQFRQWDKQTKTGILYEGKPKDFAHLAKKLQAFSINIPLHKANKKTINKIHAESLQVWVYTVDKPEDFLRLEALGADALFTNFPEEMLKLSGKK